MTPEQRILIEKDCEEVLAVGYAALEPLRNTRLLVTGGTGFLGAWLAELVACLNERHGFGTRIILLSTHANAFGRKALHLASRSDVLLLEQDVRYLVDLPEDVNWIVHAAGSPDSRLHVSDPLRTLDVIVNGAASLLAAAARLPALRNVLNVSSGWVYGAQPVDVERIPEHGWGALDPNAIGSVYAEAKRCAETVCAAYRNEHRLSIVTARPFAYIGPYQLLDKPWAVNNFLRDALRGGPIRILGDPETVRSYLYASEMAFWILRCLVAGKSGQSFNVGSPHAVTLLELARMIVAAMPGKGLQPLVQIALPNLHKDACRGARFVPDVALAQTALGLRVNVDLDTAIRRTLQWNQHEPEHR